MKIKFTIGVRSSSEIADINLAFFRLKIHASDAALTDFPRSEEMGLRKAYVTLLTNNSYLAAALVLNESLKQAKSKYPLVIMSTPSTPSEAREALTRQGLEVVTVDSLKPTPNTHTLSTLDARFADTWTKLR